MKAFAARFESALDATLPPLSSDHADEAPRFLGANAKEALAHQQAARNAMKKDQEDLQATMQNTSEKPEDLEAMLAALENQQRQEAEATCVTMPLPELLQGPKHVAEFLMETHRQRERGVCAQRGATLVVCFLGRQTPGS